MKTSKTSLAGLIAGGLVLLENTNQVLAEEGANVLDLVQGDSLMGTAMGAALVYLGLSAKDDCPKGK